MQILLKTLKKEIFPISLILILALARLIPHPPNFTPIVAVAIMSSCFFRNIYLSFAVIIVSMLLADVFIGFYNNMFFVYLSLLLIAFIFLKKYPLIIATAMIGVKLGGWGINLANAKIKIRLIGKISFFKIPNKSCIILVYSF